MTKINIINESRLNDEKALILVLSVIAGGRISGKGKSYCYATYFKNSKVIVYAEKKTNDIFTIIDDIKQ